jgi:hypothetical protein
MQKSIPLASPEATNKLRFLAFLYGKPDSCGIHSSGWTMSVRRKGFYSQWEEEVPSVPGG